MAAYATLTGRPALPPLWSLGYQQSHRTLASRAEVVAEAETFRSKKLPCDALIYLGTGFCPSGWNTGHGSWDYNPAVFDDPPAVVGALRDLHFRVIPHIVIRAKEVAGSVTDPFDPKVVDESAAGSYWNAHRKVMPLSDGWWPDEGDPLDIPSRLNRIRMYAEGEQLDRPAARPFALHRNGYAGMQRYAAFLWSGDVYSTWETLKTHIPIAINTGLSGIPLWGTDIGGFVPTKEFTGELYVRWFQFGAFCPSFRAHGRTWKLRLPWGWDTGSIGVDEIRSYGEAANPGPEELHNAAVEPICRQYLELRYRLLPYLYSVIREGLDTGLPIIRALWLHHADDPVAVAPRRRVPLGPRPPRRPRRRAGGDRPRRLPPARDLARLLDRRGGRGRPRGPAPRRPGDDPDLRPLRRHHPVGAGQAVHRRGGRRPDRAGRLPRRPGPVRALRRRRDLPPLPRRRLGRDRPDLG